MEVKEKGLLDPLHCNAEIYLKDKKVGKCQGNWRSKEITIEFQGFFFFFLE